MPPLPPPPKPPGDVEQRTQRTEQAPPRRVRQPAAPARQDVADAAPPLGAGFVARDGDVLCVAWPEVKMPVGVKFLIVGVGGSSYERRLVEGDDPDEQYRLVYEWLDRTSKRDGVRKAGEFAREARGGGDGLARPDGGG